MGDRADLRGQLTGDRAYGGQSWIYGESLRGAVYGDRAEIYGRAYGGQKTFGDRAVFEALSPKARRRWSEKRTA
jgi:hypothetical protein